MEGKRIGLRRKIQVLFMESQNGTVPEDVNMKEDDKCLTIHAYYSMFGKNRRQYAISFYR